MAHAETSRQAESETLQGHPSEWHSCSSLGCQHTKFGLEHLFKLAALKPIMLHLVHGVHLQL